jgi:hypothetical protein
VTNRCCPRIAPNAKGIFDEINGIYEISEDSAFWKVIFEFRVFYPRSEP